MLRLYQGRGSKKTSFASQLPHRGPEVLGSSFGIIPGVPKRSMEEVANPRPPIVNSSTSGPWLSSLAFSLGNIAQYWGCGPQKTGESHHFHCRCKLQANHQGTLLSETTKPILSTESLKSAVTFADSDIVR